MMVYVCHRDNQQVYLLTRSSGTAGFVRERGAHRGGEGRCREHGGGLRYVGAWGLEELR